MIVSKYAQGPPYIVSQGVPANVLDANAIEMLGKGRITDIVCMARTCAGREIVYV